MSHILVVVRYPSTVDLELGCRMYLFLSIGVKSLYQGIKYVKYINNSVSPMGELVI